MAKFEIKFKHVVENIYTTEVEAESEEQAIKDFYDDPFGFGTPPELENEIGIEVDIQTIKEF